MDSPATGTQRSRPRSHRKPLQPKNSLAEPRPRSPLKPKPAPRPFENVSPADEIAAADKENRLPGSAVRALPAGVGPMDTSLAEELGAVRRWRERLRTERERTEEMLVEKGRLLDRVMREVERRWEEQRRVELELRRLIKLQEFGSPCGRISPIQSLRERGEEKKKKKDAQSQRSFPIQSLREREEEEKKKDAQSQVIKKEETQIVVKENVEPESRREVERSEKHRVWGKKMHRAASQRKLFRIRTVTGRVDN